MQEYLTPSLFTYGSLSYGSDSRFFREIPSVALSLNMVGRPTGCRAVGCGKRTALQSQTLGCFRNSTIATCNWQGVWNQDLIQPQSFALQTLPKLLWSGFQGLAGGLAYLDYDASAVNYWREQGIDGSRLDLNPRLTVPWMWSRYLDGWVSAGVDAAAYDVSGHQVNVIPVGTQGLTIQQWSDVGRAGAGWFDGSRHTLHEPRGTKCAGGQLRSEQMGLAQDRDPDPAIHAVQLCSHHRPEPISAL